MKLIIAVIISSVIRQKGESQENKKTKHAKFPKNESGGKKCSFFWKIWRALFS